MTTDRSNRVQRVERELLELLTRFLLQEFDVQLPCYASISATEVSPDLRHARVFFRLIGPPKDTKAASEVLASARKDFQNAVARGLKMKFCPVLRLEFGHVERQDEIDVLFENLRKPKIFGD